MLRRLTYQIREFFRRTDDMIRRGNADHFLFSRAETAAQESHAKSNRRRRVPPFRLQEDMRRLRPQASKLVPHMEHIRLLRHDQNVLRLRNTKEALHGLRKKRLFPANA